MQTATIHQLKKELATQDRESLIKLCLRLARFKLENKELLTYLIFDAADEDRYIAMIKMELDTLVSAAKKPNIYYTKKSLRKTLRFLDKVIRFSGKKQTEIELRIHFIQQIKEKRIPIHRSKVLVNMLTTQFKKINVALEKVHEDLQYDYGVELAEISTNWK
ncbi:MAG: hypothetical protein HKN76_20885 [Saprospiraceae bacterium]|nr:hypothetical protein [Saprospiraceae bacterium]